MDRFSPVPVAAFVILAIATACAPAAPPAPTAAPPKPAATAAPTAQPATSPAASPAAKPAASPAATQAAARPEDIKVPKPSGNLNIKLGDTAALTYSDLGFALTAERLNKEGWKLERLSFAQTELSVEALAKGDVQFTNVASNLVMAAIQKGAKVTMVANAQANEWVVVSKADLKKCEDLNGKRVAYHSEGAVSTTMLKTWITATCKGTPQYLVIAGSENRAVALMNGQIDATPLKTSDWVRINAEQPGKFHLLVSFAEGLADLATEPYATNVDWLQKNRDVAVAFFAELLKTHRMLASNPKLIEEAAPRLLEEKIDPKALPEAIRAYQAIDIFPVNGGLTPKKVEGTIKFFEESGVLQPGLTVDKVADLSVLEDALKIVGRIPGRE